MSAFINCSVSISPNICNSLQSIMPFFSILMSIYVKERPEFLRQALDSIFDQTKIPNEVVIVEDGPLTTELYSVLDEYGKLYPQLKRVPLATNGGLGKALNEGLKHCSNELVARMDTDDISVPERFEKQLKVFEEFPQVEIVSSWIDEFVDTPDNIISTRKVPQYPYEVIKYGKKRCPINHPVVMFKKSSVLFAGNYQSFPLFEDYYLWVRLLLNGAKFYNIQESLLRFRTSEDMYKRRGGLRHAITEVRFQNHIRKLGFVSFSRFMLNVPTRFIARVIPNGCRMLVYRTLLRK